MESGMGDELNKNFQFRLDKRDPNEAIAWELIEKAAEKGIGLRELATAAILQYADVQQIDEAHPDKLLRQLRFEIQRFAEIVDQASEIGLVANPGNTFSEAARDDSAPGKLSKKLMRNIAGLISEATEYGDDE